MEKGKDYIGVGVGAVIFNEKNEILLLMRKKEPEKGCWSIPGGAVEFGEKVEDALVRELEEELEIKVKIVKLLRVTDHIIKESNDHWVSPAFLASYVSGSPHNAEPENHEDMRWFPMNSVPENITMTTSLALKSYHEMVDRKEKIEV